MLQASGKQGKHGTDYGSSGGRLFAEDEAIELARASGVRTRFPHESIKAAKASMSRLFSQLDGFSLAPRRHVWKRVTAPGAPPCIHTGVMVVGRAYTFRVRCKNASLDVVRLGVLCDEQELRAVGAEVRQTVNVMPTGMEAVVHLVICPPEPVCKVLQLKVVATSAAGTVEKWTVPVLVESAMDVEAAPPLIRVVAGGGSD